MTNPEWAPRWGQTDFEINESNLVYDGVFKVTSLSLRHRLFAGGWSPWLRRENIRRQDAVAAILYDPDRHAVVMVEQFRVGLVERSHDQSPWMLEIVAGLLEEGESTIDAIRREVQEEAGCEIQQLIPIGAFYNTPGGFSEKTTVFCGIINAQGIGGIHGADTEGEDILVHVLPCAWLFDAIEQGTLVTSASTMIAIQWLRLYEKKHDTNI